jgi:DNA polymerase III epsilon subunit-like protein
MTQVMLDLETLGTRAGCVILSIGAVAFSLEDGAVATTGFYSVIYRNSCEAVGLLEDPGTLSWWLSQPGGNQILHETRDPERTVGLGEALADFRAWYQARARETGQTHLPIWSNGASFDLPILTEAYARCGYTKTPWRGGKDDRCYRTLKNLLPHVKTAREGNLGPHHAFGDALHQAHHALDLLAELARLEKAPA